MDLLKEKISMNYHDKVEKILDFILSQEIHIQTKKFDKLYEFIKLKYATCRELQRKYPNNQIINHNTDVFALCLTSAVCAKQCILSNIATYQDSHRRVK